MGKKIIGMLKIDAVSYVAKNQALSISISALADNLLSDTQQEETAWDTWNALRNRYASRYMIKKSSILCSFTNTKLRKCDVVDDHTTSMWTKLTLLAAINDNVN